MCIRMCIWEKRPKKQTSRWYREDVVEIRFISHVSAWNYSCQAFILHGKWHQDAINLFPIFSITIYQYSIGARVTTTQNIYIYIYISLSLTLRIKITVRSCESIEGNASYVSARTNALLSLYCDIRTMVLRYNYERWRPIVVRTPSDQRVCAYAATF